MKAQTCPICGTIYPRQTKCRGGSDEELGQPATHEPVATQSREGYEPTADDAPLIVTEPDTPEVP